MLLVSFGLSGFHAEDDPNDAYAYNRTESVLHLSLEAPAGTSLSAGGPAANIGIYVRRHSWEIWRQPSTGFEEHRDANNAPESGASVNLSLSDAMGTLGDSTVITNADGFATTTYSPDGGSGSVFVNAAVENSTASLFFDVTYTTTGYDESYSYSHTEATLVAELSATGSTDHLYPGESLELSLSVRYETWDVMTNSFGFSRTENHTSAPAEGASVTWISGSGDASVSGYGMADATGFCQGSLTMGSGDSIVRTEVSYAAGQATSASLYFAAATYVNPSGWTYSRSETIASISNLAAGGSTTLSTGETRSLTGEIRHEVWDVWVNGYGMEDWRYNYAGPAAWATVTAAIEFGDGSLGSTTVTSDGQGWFSLDYTMGSSSSRVTVSADGATSASGTNGSASVDFTYSSTTGQPDYGNGYDNSGTSSPFLLSYEGNYRIEGPHSDGPTYDLTPGTQRTVSGVLYWDSWEVWSDGSGNTMIQNHQSHPATWSGLTLSLAQGDGLIADSSITTDSSGGFSTTFTMGNGASRVRIEATGGSSGTIAAELDFTPPPAGPVDDFVKVRDESSLFVAITGGSPQAGTEAIPLEAQVTETSWEVWENGIAPAELRNYRTGPAIGASVEFMIASGSGNLTAIDSLTDADGTARASIIPGQADTVVAVNASFLTTGASGQITVSPVPWVRQSIESRLLLSLQQMDNAITATVRLQSWEIWLNPATGLGEIRHESEGPAVNAEVIFQSLNTSGYDAIFSPPTVMTATAGTASASYPSLAGTMAQVTAHFAGQSVTETIHLPAASGSSGTDNGGWNGTDNGGWNGTDYSGGNGTDGNGGNGTDPGNQNQSNQQPNPNIPIPETALKGRTHSTSGGDGTPGQPAEEALYGVTFISGTEENINEYWALINEYPYCVHSLTEEQIPVSFRALLTLNTFAFDGITVTDVTEVHESGPLSEKDEILNPYLEQNYLLSEYHVDFRMTAVWHVSFDSLLRPAHDGYDALGNAFVITGRQEPYSDLDTIATIAYEPEIASLYDSLGSPPSPNVFLPPATTSTSLESSFSSSSWDEIGRVSYGNRGLPAPPTSSSADFIDGVVPSASWNEYWFQAEEVLPTGGVETKKTFILHAKQTDKNGEVTEGYGTVTFAIREGKEISDAQPVVEGLESPFTSWVEAKADGTLLVKPPVERGKRNVVSVLAVEVKVVERDDPKKRWADAADHSSSKSIYAGESTGDMVRWRLAGADNWTNVTFTWSAQGPGGVTITGPTGAGKNEWTINDDDQDTATDWLKWKPGKWKIKVQIDSATVALEQEIGWRSEEYAVIGQVVPSYAHTTDGPDGVLEGNAFRRALLYDLYLLPPAPQTVAALESLAIGGHVFNGKISELWGGFWVTNPLEPQKGPFTESYPLGVGSVEERHRLWMIQHILNVNYDLPIAPDQFTEAAFQVFVNDEKYRIIQRHQCKFLVTDSGKIKHGSMTAVGDLVAKEGPTKLNLGIAQGEFLPFWDNPAKNYLELYDSPSEISIPYHQRHQVSEDGMAVSHFASARLGPSGQKANWRLFGLEAPWIWSEIIVELQSDRSVKERVWTSIDTHWNESGNVTGDKPFNDLKIYKGENGPQSTGGGRVFRQIGHLSMENSVEDFINSATGARPEPPVPPSRQ